ncbi:MAG: tetratricopeptide repeat protein [Chloroflexi bacterium]|nr:tetratricopeptide repeat protein [Chloroflexota bacterium]
MRIQRHYHASGIYAPVRRRRRGGGGCFSALVLVGLFLGLLTLAWNWMDNWLNSAAGPVDSSLSGAQAAFARGDLDTSVQLARQLWERTPDNLAALTLLVRALIYRSYSEYNRAIDREIALEIAAAAVERFSNNPDALAVYAFALQADGQPLEAAQRAERALQSNPNQTLARLALALSYGAVGGFDVALREGQRAASQSDYPLDTLRVLAIAYSDLGRYSEAIAAIERAIILNPRLLPLYFERALYALQVGDADAATVAYFQVLAYAPDNVKARLRLCELSSMMREREAALTYCGEVTQRAPDWSEGWYRLGREYFLQGDFAAAQSNLHRCSTLQTLQNVPLAERRFECWYLQGQAAEILGDCAALVATYNEFLAMVANTGLPQTWSYPPEGPPQCANVTPPP